MVKLIPVWHLKCYLLLDDLENLHDHGDLVQYDAFVLYSREDQDFVDQVVAKMEGEYGMKVSELLFWKCPCPWFQNDTFLFLQTT